MTNPAPTVVPQFTPLWTAHLKAEGDSYLLDPDSVQPVIAWVLYPDTDGHVARPITVTHELAYDEDRVFAPTRGEAEFEVIHLCERLNSRAAGT